MRAWARDGLRLSVQDTYAVREHGIRVTRRLRGADIFADARLSYPLALAWRHVKGGDTVAMLRTRLATYDRAADRDAWRVCPR